MTSDKYADWDDDLSILSSENVSFAVETAGLGTRFAAVLIDMTLQLIVLALLVLLALTFFLHLPTNGQWMSWASSIGGALLWLVIFLISYGYFFFFEWLMDGQTPGKRWCHLRVMQTSAMPATVWPLFVRNLLRIIDFLPFLYGAGALVAVLNPHNRRIGDLVAGTIVARERPHGARRLVLDIDDAVDAFIAAATAQPASVTPTQPTVMAASDGASDTLTASPTVVPDSIRQDAEAAAMTIRISAQDYELAREFLLRRTTMQPIARYRLANSLAARLSHKLGEAPPAESDAEAFLERVTRIIQSRENAAHEAFMAGRANNQDNTQARP